MQKLVNSLPAILAAAGDSADVREAACVSAWKVTTGDTLSQRAIATEFKNETLIVLVEDAVWQKQLEQMRPQLMWRVNSMLGEPLVKAIEFRIEVAAFGERRQNAEVRASHAPIPVELLSAAAQIEDVELRRAFLGAASSCLQRIESDANC